MQDIRNMQNTADILTKKCSRCKKEQVLCNFGFKLNTDPYRTCKRCRKQPIIDNNHSGSSNDHLNMARVVENPVIENPIVEDKLVDEPKIEKLQETNNNDNDPFCILKLSDIFTDYGYRIKPLTSDMIELLFDAMGKDNNISYLINKIIDQNYIALSECEDGVNLLFPPDDKTLYLLTLNNTNLINNFTSKIKYKNKRRCNICSLKQSRHFKMCSQCNKEYCNECFVKANQKYLCCPFCRYTMKAHIDNNIKKYNENKSKVFKCILEAKKRFLL